MKGVVVDSSVWISALNKGQVDRNLLASLIDEGYPIYTCKVIQVEVSQGAKNIQAFQEIWDSFFGFEFLEVDDHIWNKSATNYFNLRKQGITMGTIDCLIASLCQFYEVALMTHDKMLKKTANYLNVPSKIKR